MHLTRGWTTAAAFIARRAAGQGVRLLSSAGTEKEGSFARSQPLIGPTYIVWGAGTDIGKTLVSAAICNFLGRTGTTPGKAGNSIFYYKPVQTGFPEDSDADTVASVCGGHTEFGDHAGQLLAVSGDVSSFPEILDLDPSVHLDVTARVEFAWSHPVSPHLAVKMEGRPVSDDELVAMMTQQLNTYSKEMALKAAGRQTKMYTLVETAGAVNSPAPSGRSQADIYRSLRLPGIMVGDGKIGGIASTISAMESLILRGMDVSCVVMLDKGMGNERQIAEMLKSFKNYRGESVPVFVLPPIPKRRTERAGAPALRSWILQCHDKLKKIQDKLDKDHSERMTRMSAASELALSSLWWPFTQHALVNKVTVIDSRAGEEWWVYKHDGEDGVGGARLETLFDAPASWWTQGVDEKLQPMLTRAAAYGAGRYAHVLFPENATEASLELATRLLNGVGKGWASRVFYSDNGSTAVEVAIKMALRKYMHDHNLLALTDGELSKQCFSVIGLAGSYHGDTLGAMDVQSPSVFTGPKQMTWYTPRGHWLSPPTLSLQKGAWVVDLPASLRVSGSEAPGEERVALASWEEACDMKTRLKSPLAALYKRRIDEQWEAISAKGGAGHHVAALVMEAVMHGAGGMELIDPLFQHLLAAAAKARRVPVIMDEVFSGIWRLGQESGSRMVGVQPDVACFGKLLTGGTVPLAVTLATEEVFAAFKGQAKSDGLLHGHSYTAHPVGCSVAIAALDIYADPLLNLNYDANRGVMKEVWPQQPVLALSCHPAVRRVVAMGSVLVVELQAASTKTRCDCSLQKITCDCAVMGEGYTSQASKPVVAALRQQGVYVRPLGNVIYFMVTPTTDPAKCAALIASLLKCLPK